MQVVNQFKTQFAKEAPNSDADLSKFKEDVLGFYSKARDYLDKADWLDDVADKSGLNRDQLVLAVTGTAGMILILSFFVQWMGIFLTRMVGFCYPLYRSIEALGTKTKTDDTQWLTYWVVFAFFSLFEQIVLRPSSMLPLYFILKLALLLPLQLCGGAEVLYKYLIRPMYYAFASMESFVPSEKEKDN